MARFGSCRLAGATPTPGLAWTILLLVCCGGRKLYSLQEKTCGKCSGPTVPLCGVAVPSRQRRGDAAAAADRAVIMSSRILTPSAKYGVS